MTLTELLIVITIILLVSAVALPTVIGALGSREVSEAGRILHGALTGARDKAIHQGSPAGIRLLPDPTLISFQPATWPDGTPAASPGALDQTRPLAYNRIVPIGQPPEYREGLVTPISVRSISTLGAALSIPDAASTFLPGALMLIEMPVDPSNGAPNSPTSWFWSIRVGDKVQINDAGPWYTVVGPVTATNTEQFVNVGPPAAMGAYSGGLPSITVGNTSYPCEFLLLVDGKDDNRNGWTDEGFDGVDNDGDGLIDETACALSTAGEWEQEGWAGGVMGATPINVPYSIRRRPAVLPGAREVALPGKMVIDATAAFLGGERSRLPVNRFDGTCDILLNPDGTVVPTTVYSSPSSFGMASAWYHFWLADREDVVGPPLRPGVYPPVPVPLETIGGASHYLPIAQPNGATAYTAPVLKQSFSVLSLGARSGLTSTNRDLPFFYDPSLGYTNTITSSSVYSPVYPFVQAEQGLSSGGQ